jgi:hypothetical protein
MERQALIETIILLVLLLVLLALAVQVVGG